MLKSELIEKIKDIADDADINETIQGIDGLIKPFDVKELDLDGFKNVLEQNSAAKNYFTGSIDSAVSKGVESFKKNTMPKYIKEAVDKALKESQEKELTPEQKQLKEALAKIDKMEAEKAQNELLKANEAKLKEVGLTTDLAKYIKDDSDIEFFNNLISNTVNDKVKERLNSNSYTVPKIINNTTITKEQFNKMNYNERIQLFNENKELYNELNK